MVFIIKKIKIFTLLFIIILIPTIVIVIADNYYSDRTTMYIGKQIEMSSSKMFQNVVNQNILKDIDTNKLVSITYNETSNISSVIINTKLVNQILIDANNVLSEVFYDHLDEYFTDLEIPLGTLFSKSIFSGKGPVIKIPITPVGSYKVDILTNTVSYGINNSLIELYLSINVDIEALIPLQKTLFPSETKIIILSQLIQGEIPKYYYSSNSDESFPYIPDN